MQTNKKETMIKAVAFFLLVVSFLLVHLIYPDFFPRMIHLTTSGDINTLVEFFRSFGIWAMFFSFWLDVLVNALGFLPSIFISTANGIVFGIVPGIIISWLAETVGVIISFLLMRTILRSSAEKIIAKSGSLKKIDEFSGKKGFQLMLIMRTIPYFPSGVLTALGALSSISLRDYALANLIGKFPSTALEVVVGHDIVLFEENLLRLTLIVIGATAVYGFFWYYQRKESLFYGEIEIKKKERRS